MAKQNTKTCWTYCRTSCWAHVEQHCSTMNPNSIEQTLDHVSEFENHLPSMFSCFRNHAMKILSKNHWIYCFQKSWNHCIYCFQYLVSKIPRIIEFLVTKNHNNIEFIVFKNYRNVDVICFRKIMDILNTLFPKPRKFQTFIDSKTYGNFNSLFQLFSDFIFKNIVST